MDALLNQVVTSPHQDTFGQDGVVVFENVVSPQQIRLMVAEIAQLRQRVMQKIVTMPRPLRDYTDIAERSLNRLDYRCGFSHPVFADVAKPIIDIIKTLSPTVDFRHYWGAIPALSGSGPTDMHRDVYPILNTSQGMDLSEHDLMLPPYYFTVLLPLVNITAENGPTQFIKGSFKEAVVDSEPSHVYAPLLAPGDIVIFDGRTMHRGASNISNEERLVAYITFVANWYHDQTFTINDYLFPELAVSGK